MSLQTVACVSALDYRSRLSLINIVSTESPLLWNSGDFCQRYKHRMHDLQEHFVERIISAAKRSYCGIGSCVEIFVWCGSQHTEALVQATNVSEILSCSCDYLAFYVLETEDNCIVRENFDRYNNVYQFTIFCSLRRNDLEVHRNRLITDSSQNLEKNGSETNSLLFTYML